MRDSHELVAAAQAGDAAAFGELYTRYHPAVFSYLTWRLTDRDLAEDLAADTFVKAWQRIDTFTYTGRDFGAWLITITRNGMLDHLKRNETRLCFLPRTAIGDFGGVESHPVDGPDVTVPDQHERAAVSARLDELTARLNPAQREVLRLRFVEGMRSHEVADAIGSTLPAVKAMQTRAVARIRQMARLADHPTPTEFADAARRP